MPVHQTDTTKQAARGGANDKTKVRDDAHAVTLDVSQVQDRLMQARISLAGHALEGYLRNHAQTDHKRAGQEASKLAAATLKEVLDDAERAGMLPPGW